MKRTGIDLVVTEIVQNYLNMGYHLNLETMPGSEHDIAHFDLRKGDDLIRVRLESFVEPKSRAACYLGVITGRVNYEIKHDLIWNGRLEVIEERKFYAVDPDANGDDKWYIEGEEGLKAYYRHCDRQMEHDLPWRAIDLDLDKARKIMLPWIRKQPGHKTLAAKGIQKVQHCIDDREGSGYYYIVTTRQTFTTRRKAANGKAL